MASKQLNIETSKMHRHSKIEPNRKLGQTITIYIMDHKLKKRWLTLVVQSQKLFH
jgi:hypothetical protein